MTSQSYILASTNSLSPEATAAAEFILVPDHYVEHYRSLAAKCQAVMQGAVDLESSRPHVSFYVGSLNALDTDGLMHLGLLDDEIDAIVSGEPRLVTWERDDVDAAVSADLWRAADSCRLVIHEDGEVWCNANPKYGEPYEACIAPCLEVPA